MPLQFRSTRTLVSLVLLTTPILFAGCSESVNSLIPAAAVVKLTGNWQLSSSAAAAAQLPALSGELTGSSNAVTGLFHSDSKAACAAPSIIATVQGSTDAAGLLTLSGPYAGGALSITGTPASDGKSLVNATYNVSGGACGFQALARATAQSVATVTGTYAGNFYDLGGNAIYITTVLSQTAPDANGNFVLSGSANLPANNGCFNSPTSTDSAQVTGQNFTISYSDPATGNSLTTSGMVSTDATTLTIGSWTVTGPCSGENGTGGSLIKQ